MKQIMAIGIIAALALAVPAFSDDAGQGKGGAAGGERAQQVEKDRNLDQERLRSRDELRSQAQLRDNEIYGHELMTKREMNRYRSQLENMKTAAAREQFQRQHEERMRERALQMNKDLVPPGQAPVYRGELMSVQERNEYREQLRRTQSEEERTTFMARHREEMDRRAEAVQQETEEAE